MKMEVKEIELKGHIIDSFILPKVFDTIMDLGGNFQVLVFDIGKHKKDPSYTRILVKAKDRGQLDNIFGELHKLGATVPEIVGVELSAASKDRTLPDNFYSTTNHLTHVRIDDVPLIHNRNQHEHFCKRACSSENHLLPSTTLASLCNLL